MSTQNPGVLTHLSEENQLFYDSILGFAKANIGPKVSEMDEKETLDKGIVKELFEMGVMGIEIPEQYGGAGGSFFQAILAIEALAQVDPGVSVFVDVQNTLVENAFIRWGNDSQKEKYLTRLAKDTVGAYCLSEPGSGSDAFALQSKAVEDGDSYVLTGKKVFITNALEADIFLFFANVNPELGYKGITAFIVEKGMEGFSIGKKEEKLGIRSSSTCEVLLDNCRVPKENVLGVVGKGYKIAIETLNEGRIGIAAQMLGLAEGAYSHSKKYIQEREQFGKQLSSFQGIQFQLAKMATDIEAAKLLVYNAAFLKESGKSFIKEAAMAKLFASQVAESVASMAVEMHGGYGFTREFPVEKLYRDAKIGKIYEGTSNMQLQTIAKLCLSES